MKNRFERNDYIMIIPIRQMYKDMIGEELLLCEFLNHLLKTGNKDLADKIGNFFISPSSIDDLTLKDFYKTRISGTFIFQSYNNDFNLKEEIQLEPTEFSIDEKFLVDYKVRIKDIQYI